MTRPLAMIGAVLLAGGLVFGGALTRAEGRGAPPAPAAPPAPPAPPAPTVRPTPPTPPRPPHMRDDVRQRVDEQLRRASAQVQRAREQLAHQNLPPKLREKLEKRLAKVQQKLDQRVGHLDLDDLADLGDEIGDEMDQFGSDMDEWGKEYGAQVQHQVQQALGKLGDNDGDDDSADSADDDNDDADVDVDVRDLGDLSLCATQRADLAKVRADSAQQVATAERALAQASEALHKTLANEAATDAQIGQAIDEVSHQEAAIRRARILAWVHARRLLNAGQRAKVEHAVGAK
jgi:hypothetical protein